MCWRIISAPEGSAKDYEMKKAFVILMIVSVLIGLAVVVVDVGATNPRSPECKPVIVDGLTDEWNDADFMAYLFRDGDRNAPIRARLYLAQWDGVMYAMVRGESPHVLLPDGANNWVMHERTVLANGYSGNDGSAPDYAAGVNLWEASWPVEDGQVYRIRAGTIYDIDSHAETAKQVLVVAGCPLAVSLASVEGSGGGSPDMLYGLVISALVLAIVSAYVLLKRDVYGGG